MMKALFLIAMVTTVLMIDTILCADSDDVNKAPPTGADENIERMKINHLALYKAIHHFALPTTNFTRPVNQRFILQIPGKVLNPADYHPGDEYEKFLKNPHKMQKEVQIPPMIMEKMFQLSDAVPGTDTLSGGETGYSLARIYESVLGTMDVVNFAELNAIGKKKIMMSLWTGCWSLCLIQITLIIKFLYCNFTRNFRMLTMMNNAKWKLKSWKSEII